jgi:hypothetical protein
MSQKRKRITGSTSANSRVIRPRPVTAGQKEALSWIEEVIVPALVENFIRMKAPAKDGSGE